MPQVARFLADTPEEQRAAVMRDLASRDLDELRIVRRDHPSHAALLAAIYRAVCHAARSPPPSVDGSEDEDAMIAMEQRAASEAMAAARAEVEASRI